MARVIFLISFIWSCWALSRSGANPYVFPLLLMAYTGVTMITNAIEEKK